MSPTRVPRRYRLTVRQSVPILTGLVGLLGLLIVLGYLYARERVMEAARAQMSQFVGSLIHYSATSRQWSEQGMLVIAGAVEQALALPPEEQEKGDALISGLITDRQGHLVVDVHLLDGGLRRYDSTGLIAAVPDPGKWSPKAIGELRSPRWMPPGMDEKRNLILCYSVPLVRDGETFGVASMTLPVPWFTQRLRSISVFKNCTPFFLLLDGSWTLPPSTDATLTQLRTRMLRDRSGDTPVRWENQQFIAVYLPFATDTLIGVLIPRNELFGRLDALTCRLGVTGLIVLLLAAYGLRRASLALLAPLPFLAELAARLARGKLDSPATPPAPEPSRFPDEPEQLRMATEQLRLALRHRVHDLTLMAHTRERLFGELAFARTLQENLRPENLPSMPELKMAAFVYTAREVCGDMYDCFFQTPRRLCCIMGNVAERGVPAALLTGRVIPLLHELLLAGFTPAQALDNVNNVLASQVGREVPFVSVLTGILDLDAGTFRWASAGQLPPFRSVDEQVGQLPWSGNIPLGIRASERYGEQEIRLKPGELLLFACQRLLSVPNPEGRGYGEDALRRVLTACASSPQDVLRELLADVRKHADGPPQDDLVLFALRWLKAEAVQQTCGNTNPEYATTLRPCVPV